MGKINLLSFEVANLIAAGEVVDRPASAVKELLENAIDSGAHHITLEIQRGGVAFIRVADDGCGIEKEDLAPAIKRHSTSKIKNAEDLNSITTLGFRGEALAAISSVSRFRIYSKLPGAEMGALLEADGGRIKNIADTGCREGTTVIVEDLFYNVPARRKFLKKDSTEAVAIGGVIEKIALSHPEISFKFISDGEVKFMTSGSGELREAIWALYGKDTAMRALKVDREENGIRIVGYTSESDMFRSNRNMENFFINGRYIKSKTASAAIEQAYASKIPHDKFPFCVLNIILNPAAVDVNVHPAKLEVKFANEKVIFDAVYYAVLSALEASVNRPQLEMKISYGQSHGQSKETSKAAASSAGSASGYTASQLVNAFAPLDKRQPKADQLTMTHEKSKTSASIPDYSGVYEKYNLGRHVNNVVNNDIVNTSAKNNEVVNVSVTDVSVDDTIVNKPAVRNKEETAKQADMPTTDIELPKFEDAAQFAHRPDNRPDAVEADGGERKNVTSVHTDAEGAAKPKNDPYAEICAFDPSKIPEYTIIGEAFNTYVIVQIGEELLMIDKHAAHERIIFDELCRKMREGLKSGSKTAIGGQMLLSPIEVNLLSPEVTALEEYEDKIKALGFGYTTEKTGASTYKVSVFSIPDTLDTAAAEELFTSLAGKLSESTASVESAAVGFFETRLWQASCKAAIKGGRVYDNVHIKWICDRLLMTPEKGSSVIRTCPHGRPVAFEIKKSSIDRQFGR
jgi:DNA mismatch repair protein MutL